MIDRETKMFLWLMGALAIIILPIVFWGLSRLDQRNTLCIEQSGIMVKSLDGWQCIRAEVLK